MQRERINCPCGRPRYARGLCRPCYEKTPAQCERRVARQRRYNATEKGRERVRRSRLKHAERVAGIDRTQGVIEEAPPQTLDDFLRDIMNDLSSFTTPPPAESTMQASEANALALEAYDVGAPFGCLTFEADQQRMHLRLLRGLTPFRADTRQSDKGSTQSTEDRVGATHDVIIDSTVSASKQVPTMSPQRSEPRPNHPSATADSDCFLMRELDQSGSNHFSIATALRVLANERKRGW